MRAIIIVAILLTMIFSACNASHPYVQDQTRRLCADLNQSLQSSPQLYLRCIFGAPYLADSQNGLGSQLLDVCMANSNSALSFDVYDAPVQENYVFSIIPVFCPLCEYSPCHWGNTLGENKNYVYCNITRIVSHQQQVAPDGVIVANAYTDRISADVTLDIVKEPVQLYYRDSGGVHLLYGAIYNISIVNNICPSKKQD